MAVQFVLGRAGAGKTHWCLSSVRARLESAAPEERLILLVPEQASFQMERALALALPRGAFSQAEVLSFSRLAQRVADERSTPALIVSRAARQLALRLVGQRRAARLRAFRRSAESPGFYAQLERVIEQLLLEGVSPEELLATAERSHAAVAELDAQDAPSPPQAPVSRPRRSFLDDSGVARAADIAALYADYLAWLGTERVDPAARFALLAERLGEAAWVPAASVWVDGFAGFTGLEQTALCALATRCRDLWIALLVEPDDAPAGRGDAPDELDQFQYPEQTLRRLTRMLTDAGAVVRPALRLPLRQDRMPGAALPRFVSPQLARLERRFCAVDGDAVADRAEGASDVRLVLCPTQREELVQAARAIRRKVVASDGKLRFRDFAVIARDLEPFAELAAEVFAEYELPCFIDRRRPLAVHALSRWLGALFDCLRSDFDVEPVVCLLQSGLLAIQRGASERLEQTITEFQIRGFAQWCAPAWELRQRGSRGRAAHVTPEPPARAWLAAALQGIVALARGGPASGAAWAGALCDVTERLGVRRVLTTWVRRARRARRWESAEVHRLAWDTFAGLLDDLGEVLGDQALTLSDAADVVGRALAEASVGLAPPTLDQVLVGSIERSRHPDIKYAWIVGLNEGLMPAPPPDDLLLSASDRAALSEAGLDALRPAGAQAYNERLLAYVALTRASHGLALSLARSASDGSTLEPSSLLRDIRAALPELPEDEAHADPPLTLGEAATAALLQSSGETPRNAALRERLERDPRRRHALAHLMRSAKHRNRERPVGPYGRDARRPHVVWHASPSEVETRLQCPFQHFARYGLRLSTRRGPQPASVELGLLAHELLAEATRLALESGVPVQKIGDERWDEYLEQARKTLVAESVTESGRQPERDLYAEVMTARVRDVLLVHAERWRRGTWHPWAPELRFSPTEPQARRALAIRLDERREAWLSGFVDRVDLVERQGRVHALVYDYKTSVSAATVKDAYLVGHGLAAWLYLRAVLALAPEGTQLHPGGLLLAPLRAERERLKDDATRQSTRSDASLRLLQPRGLVSEELAETFDPARGDPAPVVFAPRTKNGRWKASGDLVAPDQVTQRTARATNTLHNLALSVDAGIVDPEPMLHKRRLACLTCDFAPVCRFDWSLNRIRRSENELPALQDRGAVALPVVAAPRRGERR